MKGSLLLYNLKLNCLIFFYQSEQLTGYIYTDIYCKLSKCIGQTPCSYEHYFVSKCFLRFPAATHILRVNCAEMAGDGLGHPAYDIFSIERTFFMNLSFDLLNSRSLPY